MTQPDKRRKILDAAVSVFARNGYYSSKVSDIAREAGVADGTIYLYFKNKEDLLIQVFLDTMNVILERQEQVLAGMTDPTERLRAFITTHFDLVSSSPALAEVVTVELRQSSKFMRSTDMKPFGRYLGIIARIVQEGQEGGFFASTVPARRVARALFGVLDEFALEWAMAEQPAPLSEVAEETTQLFLEGLRLHPGAAAGQ
ncbi:MAG: TetR/AcrR family transcriptional regulator [Deltaproteobacteria bacterium]|nr:TetR/AcrR family transcriptional regulator [Deltaproteobacteria bacterium]MCB9786016.1 TetR/AcrR family transcriptional regulator [Deltaproteobacteria bacterium]